MRSLGDLLRHDLQDHRDEPGYLLVTGVSRRDNFDAEIIDAGELRRDEGWAIQEIANHRRPRSGRLASGAI
jgi:hypothetical protein